MEQEDKNIIAKRLVEYVVKERKKKKRSELKDMDIMKPEMVRIAEEYGIDQTDVFVIYMDYMSDTMTKTNVLREFKKR